MFGRRGRRGRRDDAEANAATVRQAIRDTGVYPSANQLRAALLEQGHAVTRDQAQQLLDQARSATTGGRFG